MVAYSKKILFTTTTLISLLLISCELTKKDKTCYFGGEIINPNSKYMYLCKDNVIIDTIELDKNNRFFQKYDTLSEGMYTFRHEPEYQYIYFAPGDSLMIRLNTNDFDNSLAFCGRGDQKNNFLIELFLKNEDIKNSSFDIYDKDFKHFSKSIESAYQKNKTFYQRRKKEIDWSDEFDLYAKNMLEMPYLAQKEMYPRIHQKRTGDDVFKFLPKDYYSFRKNIDFNNEKLMTYSPFLKYLTAMLENTTQKIKNEDESILEINTNKLKVADSIFTNKKIKNSILNNIAFLYLLEDQNSTNNQSFIKEYLKFSTDKVKQKDIIKICESTQMLSIGKYLKETSLVDKENRKHTVNEIFKRNTVLFFWVSDAKSHMEMAHKRADELKTKYPNWDFVAVNIDGSTTKWKESLSKLEYKNILELHSNNFDDMKDKWVITKIQRTMLIENGGKIKNGFISLFDANFESYLK